MPTKHHKPEEETTAKLDASNYLAVFDVIRFNPHWDGETNRCAANRDFSTSTNG